MQSTLDESLFRIRCNPVGSFLERSRGDLKEEFTGDITICNTWQFIHHRSYLKWRWNLSVFRIVFLPPSRFSHSVGVVRRYMHTFATHIFQKFHAVYHVSILQFGSNVAHRVVIIPVIKTNDEEGLIDRGETVSVVLHWKCTIMMLMRSWNFPFVR